MNKLLQGITPLFLSLILFSCASNTKLTSISPEVQEDINKVEKMVENKKSTNDHLLSPGHYKKAKEALKDAKKSASKGEDRSVVNDYLSKSQTELNRMDEAVALGKMHLPDVLNAREAARLKGAKDLNKFKEADDELADLGEELEKRDINTVLEEKEEVRKMYVNAEIVALQNSYLSTARKNIKTASKMDGVDSYKDLKNQVQKKVTTAETLIMQNRENPNAFAQAVEDANIASRRLLARASTATWVEKNSTRVVADRIEQDFATIASPLTNIDTTVLDYPGKVKLVSTEAEFVPVLRNEVSDSRIVALRRQNALEGATFPTQSLSEYENTDQIFSAVRRRFTPPQAQILRRDRDMLIRLTGVTFAFNKTTINASARPILNKLGNIIKELDSKTVVIEGHTDNIGNALYNERLSLQRANAIKQFLVNNVGVQSTILQTRGYGFSRPITDNRTMADRRMNRRIDVTIYNVSGAQELAE